MKAMPSSNFKALFGKGELGKGELEDCREFVRAMDDCTLMKL